MAIPAAYILIWGCIKIVISDKTVNTAVDHWTKGTSTKLDDILWRLLELVAGIEDHELQELTLTAGLADINKKYADAKEKGKEGKYKKATKPPIAKKHMLPLMALGPIDTGVC